jgi:hypothetical protein
LRYFFSGLDPRYSTIFEDLSPNAGLMFSASTLSCPATFDLFLSCHQKRLPIVLDSGIIQGWIKEDAYIELLNEVGYWFEWCAHYDILHNFYGSNGNYNYARDYIDQSLCKRLLYVLHGNPAEGFVEAQYRAVMEVLTHASPYIGIGGLGRLCRRGEVDLVERYLDAIYERLGPDVCQWVHLFGIGNYQLLRRYRNIFGSADSSTWLCGVRGELLQPDGTRRRCLRPFDKLCALRHNVEMMLAWITDDNGTRAPHPLQPPYQIIPTADPYILDAMPIDQEVSTVTQKCIEMYGFCC